MKYKFKLYFFYQIWNPQKFKGWPLAESVRETLPCFSEWFGEVSLDFLDQPDGREVEGLLKPYTPQSNNG